MVTTAAASTLVSSLGIGAAALVGTGALAAGLGWLAQALFSQLGV